MNSELAKIFNEMAALLDIKHVAFKPRAYELAASSIEALNEDVKEIYKKGSSTHSTSSGQAGSPQGGLRALEAIPGVGRGIAEKIEEYIKTGHIKEYTKLKKELPVDIAGLTKIEGVGPQTVKKLYKNLKVKNVSDLEKAIKKRLLVAKGGFSKKSEERILKSLDFLKTGHGRYYLGEILPIARSIIEKIRTFPGVEHAEYAGSLRRMQETVGDLDILVTSKSPAKVMDYFVKMPRVVEVTAHGMSRSAVRLDLGIHADLRVIPPESFGAALQYFTGDKQHNIALRELAIKKGYKLNEYGLWKVTRNKRQETMMAGKTEKEIYEKLGMDWMPPELRTNNCEIEAALSGKLPKLIGYDDIKGDLQVQSDWTDGDNSIRELAEAAKKFGLEYIAITDHTQALAMTGGNDEKRLLKQMGEIDKINKTLSGIKVLKGVEVDIKKDGSLDIEDEVLAQLDVVGASVHSYFNLLETDQTKRIIRAMENPHVDILFHPTGRIVGRREAYKIDIDAIIKAAKRTKTVLEANGSNRLDLKDEYIRRAIAAGVKIAIDSDAHSVDQFDFLEYGIAQARRGWCEKRDVINTRKWQDMLKLLK